jgi:hypothetical protein
VYILICWYILPSNTKELMQLSSSLIKFITNSINIFVSIFIPPDIFLGVQKRHVLGRQNRVLSEMLLI